MPNFRSDNETPVAPAVMTALEDANVGTAAAYADDELTRALDARFSELFETSVVVVPLITGTAANSTALACIAPPWGSVFCHRNAHVFNDEGGTPELFGGGLRLVPVDGAEGKLTPADLQRVMDATPAHGIHSYQPSALTITQSTECGTVYTPREIAGLSDVARTHGLPLHMDGARFANAVASTGASPADMSWRAGVDLLSFGATKNGCMAAEALVLFGDTVQRGTVERIRKRTGHLLSKMRYVSAQLLAYITDDLWLRLAREANAQAARFARAIERHGSATLEFPVEANEVFLRWDDAGFRRLESAGVQFHRWPGRDDLARLVFAWSTTDADTDTLLAALGD